MQLEQRNSAIGLVFDAGFHVSKVVTVLSSAAWFANVIGAPATARVALLWWQDNVVSLIAAVLAAPLSAVFGVSKMPQVLSNFLGVGLALGVSFVLGLVAARSHFGVDLKTTQQGFAKRWGTWLFLFLTTVLLWPVALVVFLILGIAPGSFFQRPEDVLVGRVWMWLALLPLIGMALVLVVNYLESIL